MSERSMAPGLALHSLVDQTPDDVEAPYRALLEMYDMRWQMGQAELAALIKAREKAVPS